MGLSVASLNSGSNANCYYVGNDHEGILIDAGLSGRETEMRLQRLGISINKLKAIFITHEHGDHIKGLRSLIKKFRIPVFITQQTVEQSRLKIKDHYLRHFAAFQPVSVGRMSVTAFPKFHDAGDPHSFIISCNRINVGVFTDIGSLCKNVVHHFKQCHAAFLEANYDEEMLENGRYPYALKQRIRGGRGHLSNRQALQLFMNHRPPFMSHLFLSHLSENNNRPEIVQNLFSRCCGSTKIIVAPRYEESSLFEIDSTLRYAVRVPQPKSIRQRMQLSLFN